MPGLEETTLGRYQLERLLGRGGMAEVYLAHDEQLSRDVALKVISNLGHAEQLARFQREVQTMGTLTHEHILPVFEYGEQGPWRYLVMPYIQQGTLSERLKTRGPLSQEAAGMLLAQIASALQYAHDRGILHRDIKPSNILLRADDYAYVADFGIAKALDETSGLTLTGSVIGTPEYMAPELLEQPASPSSDIYALGILLYQMLTGHVPFEGKTPLVVLQKQTQELPVRPSLLNPSISPLVEQVVLRALEKDPHRRFQTPRALAMAYQQALYASALPAQAKTPFPFVLSADAGATTVAMRPVPQQPAAGTHSWHTGRVIAAAAVLLAILLGVVIGFGLAHNTGGNSALLQTPGAHGGETAKPASTLSPMVNGTCSAQVSINDTAGVLNSAQVCDEAKTLPYAVTIYTTKTFSKGEGDFEHMAESLVSSPSMIVIAIQQDASSPHPHVHVAILGGPSVPLTDQQYNSARDAFNSAADTGDYTGATIAALQTLHDTGGGGG
jgi:Protein kinase domain